MCSLQNLLNVKPEECSVKLWTTRKELNENLKLGGTVVTEKTISNSMHCHDLHSYSLRKDLSIEGTTRRRLIKVHQ